MKRFATVAGLCAVIGSSAPASIISDNFTSLYVFGDSLSDAGLVGPPVPPFVGNRFSNGQVWAEFFAEEFDAGQQVINTARGGATAGGMDDPLAPTLVRLGTFAGQIAVFEEAISAGFIAPGDNPLTTAWFGANDLFAIPDTASVAEAATLAANAASNVAANIRDLHAIDTAVFDDFLVADLPDIGVTPGFNDQPIVPQLGNIRLATFITSTFNAQLALEVAALEADGINIIDFDTAEVLQSLTDGSAGVVFDNVLESCLELITDPSRPFCDTTDPTTVDSFLFIDDVHPTTLAHEVFAREVTLAVSAELTPVPLPATAPLMLVGLGFLGWQMRKARTA